MTVSSCFFIRRAHWLWIRSLVSLRARSGVQIKLRPPKIGHVKVNLSSPAYIPTYAGLLSLNVTLFLRTVTKSFQNIFVTYNLLLMSILKSLFLSQVTSLTSILYLKFSTVHSFVQRFAIFIAFFSDSFPFGVLYMIHSFIHCGYLNSNTRCIVLILILALNKSVSFHNEAHNFTYQKHYELVFKYYQQGHFIH